MGVIVRVRVEHLVLDGIPASRRAEMVRAMADRLRALVDGAPGFDWTAVRRTPSVDGGAVAPGTGPAEVGRHLAARIMRGVSAGRSGGA